jgi:hypothetical protein
MRLHDLDLAELSKVFGLLPTHGEKEAFNFKLL